MMKTIKWASIEEVNILATHKHTFNTDHTSYLRTEAICVS